MTAILKQKMMDLGRDESGVAFAFTVTVSLIIFLFGFAIYACGETVRQRIELQNAADAAAYSGALVQADTISRVAVINKAMAWNYVMMTRRQMDHIVGAWLGKVTERWQHDCAVTAAAQQICACCWHKIEAVNWRVGVDASGGASEGITHQLIRLNESQNTGIPEILGGLGVNAAQNPVSLLSSLRNCIASMNQAEKELISGMKKRIENAVEFAVNANVSLTENDRKTREKREIQWSLYELQDANRYFEALKSKEESRFLGFGDFSGKGVDGIQGILHGKIDFVVADEFAQSPLSFLDVGKQSADIFRCRGYVGERFFRFFIQFLILEELAQGPLPFAEVLTDQIQIPGIGFNTADHVFNIVKETALEEFAEFPFIFFELGDQA